MSKATIDDSTAHRIRPPRDLRSRCFGSIAAVRELDHRNSAGIDVRLLWDRQTNDVLLAVADEHTGESLTFEVHGAEALDAFRHPYAYAGTAHLGRALAA
jgi:hypothetical protein